MHEPSEISIARDGQEFGPFTRAQVFDALQQGQLRLDDWAWWPGLASWVPLGSLFPTPPPPLRVAPNKRPTKPVTNGKTGRAVRAAASSSTAGAVTAEIAGEAVGAGFEAAGGAAVEGCFSGCVLLLVLFGGGTTGLAFWLSS